MVVPDDAAVFPDRIRTDRLRLDRHDAAVDPLTFYAHAGADQTDSIDRETEHVSWSPHDTPKESAEVTERFADGWTGREAATYAVFPRDGEDGAGEYAGNTGLQVDWDRRTGTLGIWLREPFWGRGYSGERAIALADLAFRRLDLDLLAVEAYPANDQSVRAIEKYVDRLGGREAGVFRNRIADADGDPRDVRRYSVSRDEYEDAVDAGATGDEAGGGDVDGWPHAAFVDAVAFEA